MTTPLVLVIMLLLSVTSVFAQKSGGILRIYHRDSPASMSIHEEGTVGVILPMMGVMNNLVQYDQHVARNEPSSIVPDLATSWRWSEDGLALTFPLREGVRWHDGKPFTAADVKCTIDLLTNQAKEKLRLNYRESWWVNVAGASVNGAHEATIHLKRPQPAVLALLASGESPMYPCHVSPRDMRLRPIGTGPFRFVEYKPNQSIKVERNPDYWKLGLPFLDGIEYTIVPNRSTALLAFVAGRFDMTFPNEVTVPLLADVRAQAPAAVCQIASTSESVGMLVNRTAPPFDNPDIRRAMALALDRRAFIDILAQGAGDIGGAMQPAPDGVWGLPAAMLADVPGYGADVAASRAQARAIMRRLGYGPDKMISYKMSTRNLAVYRDPATILIDQLKGIYLDGELELTETATWVPKLIKRDFQVGLSVLGSGVDDPDVVFFQNHVCGSARNYTGHCNPELDRRVELQSREPDQGKRRQMVWEIDLMLQQDLARPILYHRKGGTCWHPWVRGLTMMVNSQYNGWRMEEAWLDRQP